MSNLESAVKRLREEVNSLNKMVHEQGIRLTLAQAWVDFYQFAYDMFRAYGVDFKSLKEFEDTAVLDEAMELPMSQGQVKIIEYLGRLRSAVRAAIRRKQFRVH